MFTDLFSISKNRISGCLQPQHDVLIIVAKTLAENIDAARMGRVLVDAETDLRQVIRSGVRVVKRAVLSRLDRG